MKSYAAFPSLTAFGFCVRQLCLVVIIPQTSLGRNKPSDILSSGRAAKGVRGLCQAFHVCMRRFITFTTLSLNMLLVCS